MERRQGSTGGILQGRLLADGRAIFAPLSSVASEALDPSEIQEVTSVPGSRDAPRYETNYRYFDFKRL